MDNLKETLELHQKWLNNEPGGVRANLRGADLSGANLSWANLRGADLRGAYLSWANLHRANLSGADLSGANLSWANLRGADLRGVNLSGANLIRANLPDFQITPKGYPMYGFKKLSNGTVAVLKIPAEAKRTASLVGRKCRAEFAWVVSGSGASKHDPEFLYTEGMLVQSDAYDDDIRVECTGGIHFFQTYEEAEAY
jgi:hypothetical protein